MLPPDADVTPAVALGDLDGDGDLDALIGNYGQDRLYLNDGSGFYVDAPAQLPAVLDTTYAVALGDADGDGDLDALIGNYGPNRLLLNDGSGLFSDATSQLPTVPGITNAIALGDVDGDLDALIGKGQPGGGEPNRLYLNNGAGLFADAASQLPPFYGVTVGLALGDVDGDGDLDLLAGNLGPSFGPDRLYLNDSTGTFSDATSQLPPQAVSGGTLDVALGDIDGDGDLDALIGRSGPNRLYLNGGSGVFADATSQLPAVGGNSHALALGDVEGDGDLDLVIGGGYPGQTRLFVNDGSGTFTDASSQLPALLVGIYGIALGDVDGDADLDALIGNDGQDRLYLNDGAGFYADTGPHTTVMDDTQALALGDVDGDGDLDALIGNAGQSRLHLNDGTGGFLDATAQIPAISADTRALALGDVDGDAALDAVLGNAGQSRLYLNDGAGVFRDATSQVPAISADTRALALGDLDGDGDLDALIGDSGQQERLYLNGGAGVFADASAQFPASNDDTRSLVLADVDGDGDLDAWAGNATFGLPSSAIRLYLNDGTATFVVASSQLPPTSGATHALAPGDVDEDGDLDAFAGNGILGPLPGSARDVLLLNDGSGAFSDATSLFPAIPDETRALALGDVDGDGDLDAVVGNYEQSSRLPVFNLTRQLAWRGIPRIGKPLILDLYGPTLGAWFLGFSFGTANLPIPPLGTLRLAPASLSFLLGGLFDGQGRAAVTVPVPANPAFVGVPVYWQAVVVGPARFTNLEVTTATDL